MQNPSSWRYDKLVICKLDGKLNHTHCNKLCFLFGSYVRKKNAFLVFFLWLYFKGIVQATCSFYSTYIICESDVFFAFLYITIYYRSWFQRFQRKLFKLVFLFFFLVRNSLNFSTTTIFLRIHHFFFGWIIWDKEW
jgi:hypothetical protein